MSETEILLQFKNQFVTFLDELIGQFPEEGDLVLARLIVSTRMNIKDMMNIFNTKINTDDQKLKKMIKNRNESFFIEHNVFSGFDKGKVSHFKKLWMSEKLDREDKDVIWKWIDTFVFLADKYTKILSK